MATIKDIANRAGVAISTVSAVINRTAPTSADVVARVEKAIAETGYAPQRAAQTLRSGRSRLVGLVIPDVTNPHFATVARIVENVCFAAGYMTFIYNTDEDPDHEMKILRMMRTQRVAGLLLISTRSDARHGAQLMAEINVPTIFMGSAVAGTPFDLVALDDLSAGRLAAGRLLDLGHRRIFFVAGRKGVSTNDERLEGCRQAFADRGMEFSDSRVVFADFSEERALVEARRALSGEGRATGVVSLSNLMTIGVMRAIRASGLACPSDISVIGVDDFEWADIMNPPPTTIAQPVAEMTRLAITSLLDQIKSGAKPSGRRLRFEPKLVVRASCGPCA